MSGPPPIVVHRSMHSDVRESPRRLSWCSTTASRFGGSEINDFDPGGVFRDLFPKGSAQAPMEANSNSPGGAGGGHKRDRGRRAAEPASAGGDRRAIDNFPWRRRVGSARSPKRPSTPRCNHETLGPGLPSGRRTHFVSGQGIIRPFRRRRRRPRHLAFRTPGACLARGGRRCPGVETPTTLTGTTTTFEPADELATRTIPL
jgi:hypothetical protein